MPSPSPRQPAQVRGQDLSTAHTSEPPRPPAPAAEMTAEEQYQFWHLRRLTLHRLSMTPAERIRTNSAAYRWWRAGQVNHARALAARREARRARLAR